jgi:glycosyltransferase involved in cell wall biosynthesis
MQVLISHYPFPVTGAHYRYNKLAMYLAKNNKKIYWLSPLQKEFKGFSNVEFCKNRFLTDRFMMIQLLYIAILSTKYFFQNRHKIKVVVIFGETPMLAALWVRLVTNACLSIGVRSNVPKRYKESLYTKDKFQRFLASVRFSIVNNLLLHGYRKASQITVQTEHAKNEFMANYKVDSVKISVISNDLPKNFMNGARTFDLPKVPNTMLFIGNASRIKGFDLLVDAISKSVNKISIKKLTVVGVTESEAKDLKYLASHHSFEFSAIKRSNEILKLMKEHDLVVVPSREDQFPNVVLEALALKIPVIGADVDGISYMLKSKDVLFNIEKSDGLVNLLIDIFTETGYQKVLSNILTQRKRFDFNWEEKYYSILKNIRK